MKKFDWTLAIWKVTRNEKNLTRRIELFYRLFVEIVLKKD